MANLSITTSATFLYVSLVKSIFDFNANDNSWRVHDQLGISNDVFSEDDLQQGCKGCQRLRLLCLKVDSFIHYNLCKSTYKGRRNVMCIL